MKNKLQQIYNHYGKEIQLNKLVEECGELITAIARNDEANMLEEMADVGVVISQFMIIYPEIINISKEKIDRTLERSEL
jgi:NTP pyrophosphatase (non-canonical NTP hydrolase)